MTSNNSCTVLIRAQRSAESELFLTQNQKPPTAYIKNEPAFQGSDDSKGDEEESDDAENDIYDANGADEEFRDNLEAIRRGLNKPYRHANEDPPDVPAYSKSFAKVEKICRDLVVGAAEVLESSDYQDGYTRVLRSIIQRHQAIKYDSAKRIGLLGDSGVGMVFHRCLAGLRAD